MQAIHQHGARHFDVRYRHEATDILKTLGIEVDHAGHIELKEYDRWKCEYRFVPCDLHLYFFNKLGQEVAYFTPMMESLCVHDTPRIWAEEYRKQIVAI